MLELKLNVYGVLYTEYLFFHGFFLNKCVIDMEVLVLFQLQLSTSWDSFDPILCIKGQDCWYTIINGYPAEAPKLNPNAKIIVKLVYYYSRYK